MSKAYLFAAILLAGGIIGCIDVSEEDEELIEVLGIDDAYATASKFLIDKFNEALYGAVCEKLMYEDGSVYNDEDVSECVQDGYSLNIANVNTVNGTLDIIMNNEEPVAGFQIEMSGVNIIGASGGSATSAGFTVSSNSFSGTESYTIPAPDWK